MGFFSETGKMLITEMAKEVASDSIKKYDEACKKATDKIRKDIVMEWFAPYNYTDVIGAYNELNPYNKHQNESGCVDSVVITTNTYVDLSKYAPRPSAERWRKKYGGSSSPEWVLEHLQMTEGIIGLPYWESKTLNKKTNEWTIIPHDPIVRSPGLRTAILYSGKWDSFISLVKSNL